MLWSGVAAIGWPSPSQSLHPIGTRQPGPIGPQHPTEKRLIAAQEINKAKRVIKSPPSENLSIAAVRLKVIDQQGLVNQKNPYNYKSLPGLTFGYAVASISELPNTLR